MAGRTASTSITRYAGIQVQSSSLGLPIPVGWGTFRCKCNLVDYLDFNAKAQKAASGKGGSTVTGYSYSATVVLAVCEGPVDAITTVYVNGKTYVFNSFYSGDANTGTGTALAQAGLSWNTGTIGQAVWSYLTSAHADHAIGYSGLTIVYAEHYALDGGASTPNHSFEVVRTTGFGVSGTPDADPSLVLTDFLQNSRTGVPQWGTGLLSAAAMAQYQNYCLAAGLLVSPVIDSQRSASDFITELLLATNSTCVWSEGVLKMLPYGDAALTGNGKTFTPNVTPAYALNDDSYIVGQAEPPVVVTIMDQSDAYNAIQLEYLDRTNQYNMAIALASDAANVAQYGPRRKDPDTVHCICTPTVAAASAQLWLQRCLYVRAQYKFKLSWSYALLEPGDIVEITDASLGLSLYPVRIIQIDEDEKAVLEITAEDAMIGIANSPLYAMQNGAGNASNSAVDPGGVELNLLLQSGNLALSPWAYSSASITSNVANDQYGLLTADALVPAAATASHYVTQGVGAFGGLNYTFSVCLQKNAHKIARVWVTDAGFGDGANIVVDLNAGTVFTAAGSFGAGVLVSARMSTTLVAGIWQVVITAIIPTFSDGTVYGVVQLLSDIGVSSWLGDGSNAVNISQPALWQGLDDGRTYAATTTALAGPLIFNPPAVLNTAGASTWAAVAGGEFWGGAFVWASIDGTNYQQVGTISEPARFGVLSSSVNINLLSWSQDLTQSSVWGYAFATIGTGVSDPFGGAAANALILSSTGQNIYAYQNIVEPCANVTYTCSVWLKAGTLGGSVWFVLKDGAGTAIPGSGVTVTPTASWVRYAFTGTFPSGAAANPTLFIDPNAVGTSGQTVLVFGAMIQHGALGDYQPTGAGAANIFIPVDPSNNTLSVDLGVSGGLLTSASDATADNGGTLCLVDQELVCFSTATLTNTARYDLTTYLRRGYLNTTIAGHAAGAPFVRMDSAPFEFPYFATNVGQAVSVKFQSFNIYGLATQSLANCNAYSVVPNPLGATSPSSAAWTATGSTVSNAGVATPAIYLTGSSDNPSATAINIYYRQTGQTAWIPAGQQPPSMTSYYIGNLASSQTYDVAISYMVSGIEGAKQIVASAITAGAASGGSGGAVVGSDIFNSTTPGASGTKTLLAGSYTHVDVYLCGYGGPGFFVPGGKGGGICYGGSGASVAIYVNIAVTPGTTTCSWFLSNATGTPSTFTLGAVSLSAPSGLAASSGHNAAAPSNATGGTTNYQGQAGGLTNGSSGGGAADFNGVYNPQNGFLQPGNSPGGGGSGLPGGAAQIRVIARA